MSSIAGAIEKDLRRKKREQVSTTADTPTMRERLARAIARTRLEHDYGEATDQDVDGIWFRCENEVDAVLRGMLDPSEGMIDAMLRGFHPGETPRQSMRDALVNGVYSILNETKD